MYNFQIRMPNASGLHTSCPSHWLSSSNTHRLYVVLRFGMAAYRTAAVEVAVPTQAETSLEGGTATRTASFALGRTAYERFSINEHFVFALPRSKLAGPLLGHLQESDAPHRKAAEMLPVPLDDSRPRHLAPGFSPGPPGARIPHLSIPSHHSSCSSFYLPSLEVELWRTRRRREDCVGRCVVSDAFIGENCSGTDGRIRDEVFLMQQAAIPVPAGVKLPSVRVRLRMKLTGFTPPAAAAVMPHLPVGEGVIMPPGIRPAPAPGEPPVGWLHAPAPYNPHLLSTYDHRHDGSREEVVAYMEREDMASRRTLEEGYSTVEADAGHAWGRPPAMPGTHPLPLYYPTGSGPVYQNPGY